MAHQESPIRRIYYREKPLREIKNDSEHKCSCCRKAANPRTASASPIARLDRISCPGNSTIPVNGYRHGESAGVASVGVM